MSDVHAKSQALMAAVDLTRPEMAEVRDAANPAEAFVSHLARPPRPRFRFEYTEKARVLAFLREHYAAWRPFNTAAADRLADLSIQKAQGERALAGIAQLGRAWLATDAPRYGAAFERFYLAVPTGQMFNWDSFNGAQGAIELDAFFLLQDCPGFTPAGRIAFLDHLRAITADAWDTHTSHWQQLMLGPEGHNWYLHGMHVLPFLGLLFPEFARAEFYVKTGWSVIEEHVRGHLKSDGGARETTLGYQAGSMLSLWDQYLIAHRNGWPMSPGFADRLLRASKFLLGLMTPAGGIPSYGDSGHSPGGLTTLAAVAAALTGDGECKWYAERCRTQRPDAKAETPGVLPEAAFWAVGLEGAAAYAATRARNPNLTSVLFGQTGYAALRNSDRPEAAYCAIAAADRGPIVTSHGHNDVFALDVHAGGTRFLGEMGCAPYGTSPGRQYDQKTEAHNCLAIEGMEQAPILNEWRWGALVIPAVRRWIAEPTHDFFHGVHEGYYRYGQHETLHARKVFFVKGAPAYWVVMDWLESVPENDYRAWFHGCVPGRLDGTTILLEGADGARLAVLPPEGDALTATQASSDGLAAYIREKGLRPEQCPCFVYGRRAASDCLVWVLMPLAAGTGLPRVRRLPVTVNGTAEDPHGAAAVEIRHADGATDTLCVSHRDFDAEIAFGDDHAWGFLAFRRRDPAARLTLAIEHAMSDGTCGR